MLPSSQPPSPADWIRLPIGWWSSTVPEPGSWPAPAAFVVAPGYASYTGWDRNPCVAGHGAHTPALGRAHLQTVAILTAASWVCFMAFARLSPSGSERAGNLLKARQSCSGCLLAALPDKLAKNTNVPPLSAKLSASGCVPVLLSLGRFSSLQAPFECVARPLYDSVPKSSVYGFSGCKLSVPALLPLSLFGYAKL
jgi:hypothetical protein